jgi:hypothetical protein
VVTGGRLVGGNSAGVATWAEQRRGIGGRERANGRVSAVSGSGAHAGLGWLHMREQPGIGAELGRCGENGPRPFSNFEIPFPIE